MSYPMNFKSYIKESLGVIYYHGYKKFMRDYGNRTLIYHAFGCRLKHDTYGISIKIKKFKEHMKYISDNYKVVSAIDYINEKYKSISITIDDGYKDTLDALEILDLHDIPVTIFITSNFINKKDYLSDKDLYEVSKLKNVTIGAHGKSHKRFANLSYSEQKSELEDCKNKIEMVIEDKINSVSYPHGSYNQKTLDLLNSLQFEYAFSSIKGTNNNKTNRYLLRRSEVVSNDTLIDLSKKIKGFYDYY